jgi:hypothetical protein
VRPRFVQRRVPTLRRWAWYLSVGIKVLFGAIRPVTSAIRSVTPPLVYDFTEELLAGQRKFAEEVLHLAGRHAPALAK